MPRYSNGRESGFKNRTVWVRIPPGVQRTGHQARSFLQLSSGVLLPSREAAFSAVPPATSVGLAWGCACDAIATLLRAGAIDGSLRDDVTAEDIMMTLGGVTLIAGAESQRDLAGRLLDLLMAGLRKR
jgi:hypothetical protein